MEELKKWIRNTSKDEIINRENLNWCFRGWLFIAVIYLGCLYIPNWWHSTNNFQNFFNGERRPLTQEQSIDNLDEFQNIFRIFFVPLSLLGLGYTYVRYKEDKISGKKKAAHELVIKILDKVYDIRDKFDDIYYSAKYLDSLDKKQKNHINHLLNILEQVCISIDKDEIIDEEIVNSNLIYILAEQRYLFEKYIDKQREELKIGTDSALEATISEEYKPWGYLTTKIDKIEKERPEANSAEHEKNATNIVNQVKQNVAIKLHYSAKIFKVHLKNKFSYHNNTMRESFYNNIVKLKEPDNELPITHVSIYEKSSSPSEQFVVVYYEDGIDISNRKIKAKIAEHDSDNLIKNNFNSIEFIQNGEIEFCSYVNNIKVSKINLKSID